MLKANITKVSSCCKLYMMTPGSGGHGEKVMLLEMDKYKCIDTVYLEFNDV